MRGKSRNNVRLQAFQRYIVWHYLGGFTNHVKVSEFPKSGGTWLCQMLGELFELEYPRNECVPFKRCIHHSHYKGPAKEKTTVIIRDGRDVMISAYFHFLIYSKGQPSFIVNDWRRKMGNHNFDDVQTTLADFIECFCNQFKIGGRVTTWADHIMSYGMSNPNVLIVQYEKLLLNPENELLKIMEWYGHFSKLELSDVIDKFSFKKQAGRNPGEEDKSSFLRKGIVGDWENYFDDNAVDVFNKYNKRALNIFYDD